MYNLPCSDMLMKTVNSGEKIDVSGNMWMTLDKGIWVDLSGKATCEQRPE